MLEALATVVLVGLMIIPVINIGVGLIAGASMGGVAGAAAGALIGIVISLAWKSQIDSDQRKIDQFKRDNWRN